MVEEEDEEGVEGVVGAVVIEVIAAPRCSKLIPGSSLNVWMVRARLSMTVVVVFIRECEGWPP